MTTVSGDNTLKGLVTDTIIASEAKVPDPPKKSDADYRYYHCCLDHNGLKCKKVDGPNILPSKDNTKLLFIKSYIPELLDRPILKYKWIPDRVIIEDKLT